MISDKALDMHEEVIACDLIDTLPMDKTVRSFNKEFAHNLAISLKEEGLYNPIVVRPNPAKPGRYVLVQGRHRLFAWFRILKEQMIRATVLPAMDEPEAAMAAVAENIWRWDGGKTRHIKALKIWHDHFIAKQKLAAEVKSSGCPANELLDQVGPINTSRPDAGFQPGEPLAVGERVDETATSEAEQIAGTKGIIGPSWTKNSNDTQPNQDAAADKPTQPPPVKRGRGRPKGKTKTGDFIDHAVAATGVSEGTVKRELRLAKMFADEELDMFTARGISQQQIEAIAGIKDAAKRNELVVLLTSGMEFEATWERTLGTEGIIGRKSTKNSTDTKTDQGAAGGDAKLSDDAWLTTFCSEKLELLGHPEKFRSDAILYREITTAREKFRAAIKTALSRRRAAGTTGYLWSMVSRLANLSHPKDWHMCPECAGDGEIDGKECPKCRKAGCLIRTEKYE